MDLETRLVNASLNVELQVLDDSIRLEAIKEYEVITQLHGNSIDKWLSSLKAKSGDCKCGGGTAVLGEMLVHIYKKLEHLENLIAGSSVHYIPLQYNIHTKQLGHGIIILDSASLVPDSQYYVRLFLPVFPVRCVPLFAVAKDTQVLQVQTMADRDLRDYDSYIVGIEREALKARKTQKLQ
ncbi:hypothetical protein [Helicobacter trogontum]|uniref:Uncharacterized protein n=1 Tax=Helicobacter trogontum TaxID=50960 RepID=A0A4U8TG25_9HELI|nr:hypothetical protein [Helicobacter trogontum]MCI5785872.1 hypothetical protein [Helicobacter trogontum]MDY5184853.1 hypothetical protein [Helicobacter trogontum]TLD99066.1 hypothetical protein LS80_002335 [Helicobacter trogontum]